MYPSNSPTPSTTNRLSAFPLSYLTTWLYNILIVCLKSCDIEAITRRASALQNKLVARRRDFYMHPEFSGDEGRTAQKIAEQLQLLGLQVETAVGGHGVVGLLKGPRPGPTVAYRADMDALPMQDVLDTPYRSQSLGLKHACGHDAHMAIALGVAEILAARQASLPGTVKFIFQPAEESLDGARAMIKAGVLRDPHPDAIFALHTFPIPVGQLGLSLGLALAGMDEFLVRFYSPAGHLDNLIAHAARTLQSLSTEPMPKDWETFWRTVQAMQTSPAHRHTTCVSCWPHNSPQSRHHLMGLLSTPHPDARLAAHKQIRQVLDTVTDNVGAAYDLSYTFHNPPLTNDPTLSAAVLPVLQHIQGADNILTFQSPYPFAHEDFAIFAQHIPGVFIWLGTANPAQGLDALLHHPSFDIDESALIIGTRMMALVLMWFLTGTS